MKRIVLFFAGIIALAQVPGYGATTVPVTLSGIVIASSNSVSGSATVTIATPTTSSSFSSGYSNYVTNIHIEAYSKGGAAGATTVATCTSTNLPGSPSWNFGPAITTGTVQLVNIEFANPLTPSTPTAATIVTCPSTSNVLWNIIVGYFVAP